MTERVVMVFLYTIICLWFSLNAAPGEESKVKEPQVLTHKAIIRTPASSNKTLKVRIKDIAKFAGIRDNQLVGYGLVVGLNGTGDTLSSSPYTKESLIGMLERLGVNIRDNSLPSGKNVAAVMVTAKLPPFARTGTTIDIVVSALGDAKDLNGGTLLVTPLMAADGEVYAVGQGEVIVSGTSAQGVAASQVTGIPTSAKIPNGAIVEKEIAFQLTDLKNQTLSLGSPDLTTAKRVAEAINGHFQRTVALTQDSASINIEMPKGSSEKIIDAMTQIEKLEIEPDQTAKVIIDPSGVIVLGNKVRISPVALTHGSVTVRIAESASVSQPNPFTQVVNPLANNPGAPVGLGLALNGVAGQNAAASVVQTAAQTPAALGPAIPAVLLATATPPIIAAELAALPAKASLATIAAALGAAGGGAPAAPVAIPAGTTAVQIIAAMSTLPAAATPIQIASAIGAIVSAPVASTQGAPQQSFLNQAPSIMNAALNSNSPLQQATLVPETNLKIDEQKGKFAILDAGADLEELVNALNLLGTSPREMAQILQSIKAAGALHAEVIVS
jgi:flagellar P-ring protein precursor FlgI